MVQIIQGCKSKTLRRLFLWQPRITLDAILILVRSHKLSENRANDIEAARACGGGGYYTIYLAGANIEQRHNVKVKQESIDVTQRFPDPARDQGVVPHTKTQCNNCSLDHRGPTVCPAQGKMSSKCRKPNHFVKIGRSTGARRDKTDWNPRQPVLRQVWFEAEKCKKDVHST